MIYLPVARLNAGNAGGASEEMALDKFREFAKDKKYEYHVWIDDQGFAHDMTTSKNRNSVAVTRSSDVSTAKNPKNSLHNHPPNKDGYGGSFSFADITGSIADYRTTKGQTNTSYANAPEGMYKLRINGHNPPSQKQVAKAYKNVVSQTSKAKYYSPKRMWEEYNNNLSKEMKKLNIDVSFERDKSFKPKRKDK